MPAEGKKASTSDPLLHRPFSQAAARLKEKLHQEQQRQLQQKQQEQDAQREARRSAGRSSSAGQHDPRAAQQHLTDEALFAQEMRGVKRLDRDNIIPPPERRPKLLPIVDDEAEAMAQLADLVDGRADFDFIDSDEYIEGIARGLDRSLLKKLRQGIYAIQAHLDLHGKTRVEARTLVERFILESRLRSRRCVLIIHGRGLNSKDQIPVLKESLKIWLSRGRIARSVLAFCSARPVDGGVGAVYVLLRR